MKIAQITISNYAGVEFFDLHPEKPLTKITGRNSAGKTSVMQAVRSFVIGGHDAKLIRHGSKRAEIVVVWEDGSRGVKTITPKGFDVKVTDAQGIEQPRPQAQIRARLNALSVDPAKFIQGKPADRVEALIKALGVEPPVDELREAGLLYGGFELPETKDPFKVVAKVREYIYEARAAVGSQRKEAEGGVASVGESIPKETPEDCAEELEALGRRMSEVDDLFETAEALAEQDRDLAIEKARRDCSESIAKARKVRDDEAKTLQQRRGELTAKHDAAVAAKTRIADLERWQERVRTLNQAWHEHDVNLKAVDRIRDKMVENLPIPNVSIEGGEVCLGGLEVPQLAANEKVKLWWRLAKLQSGNSGLIGLDGAEALDPDNLAALEKVVNEEAAAGSDLQCFMTRVGEGPLRVTDEFHLQPE